MVVGYYLDLKERDVMSVLSGMYLIRNQQLFSTEIDNDLVMMDVDQGYYFGLNETAKMIWELLETPTVYQDVVSALVTRYKVEETECVSDIDTFIQDMLKYRLIEQVAA